MIFRKIGNQQKALIHVAKSQLGLTDDEYRDLLRSVAGVESARDLTVEQADKVMKRFKELGFVMTVKPETVSKIRQPYLTAPDRDPDALPTPAQSKKINELYEELGWAEGNRRIGFHQRVIDKPWPQTRAEANKVIEGLKSMVARKQKRD